MPRAQEQGQPPGALAEADRERQHAPVVATLLKRQLGERNVVEDGRHKAEHERGRPRCRRQLVNRHQRRAHHERADDPTAARKFEDVGGGWDDPTRVRSAIWTSAVAVTMHRVLEPSIAYPISHAPSAHRARRNTVVMPNLRIDNARDPMRAQRCPAVPVNCSEFTASHEEPVHAASGGATSARCSHCISQVPGGNSTLRTPFRQCVSAAR